MVKFISEYLPWFISFVTLYMMNMAGQMHKNTWIFGFFIQALWLIWIVCSETYGYLPLNIGLWIVYYKNHQRWKKQQSHLKDNNETVSRPSS